MIQIVGLRGSFEKPSMPFIRGAPRLVENIHQLFTNYGRIVNDIPENERFNVFYTLAHHKGASNSDIPQRLTTTFDSQTVFPIDLDDSDPSKAYDYAKVIGEYLNVPPEAFIIVNTGNGLQFLINLKNAISSPEYFSDNRHYWKEFCSILTDLIKEAGLPGHADPMVFDATRVFRVPDTLNQKHNKPTKKSSLIQRSTMIVDFDLRVACGAEAFQRESIPEDEVKQSYPAPDFPEIFRECRFISWAVENPQEVHEPHAFDLLSILSNQNAKKTVPHLGVEKTSKEIGKWVVDNATKSASLARIAFETKWNQASKYGVRKCSTINERWGECKTCPHFELINTPLALRSKDHLGSQSNGFWVKHKNKFLYPHYAELTSLFKDKYKIRTVQDGRIYSYQDGIYKRIEPLTVKSRLNQTMNPSHPIRDQHRTEFLHFLTSSTCMTHDQETDFFSNTIRNKVNFKNGVYDFETGTILPHSHEFGFKTKIPHVYVPDQISPIFNEWLDTVTLNRRDLKFLIYDMMAYCLWPKYDNHAFFFLEGDGKNGKSTLLAIIRAILGDDNISTISLAQLVNNRFAVAQLEAKAANITDEASGVPMTYAQLNILKTLSSGERYFVENKGENGYDITNTAKLIFSVNRPPLFRENTEAIRRRLIVIPFNYTIRSEDSRVGERLIAETPRILSMLIGHIRRNLEMNDGKFEIGKDSEDMKQATKKMLSAYNPVSQWADETLTEGEDGTWLEIAALYKEFVNWCSQAGVKDVATRPEFTRQMRDYVVTEVERYTSRNVNGAVVRVFTRLKHK